MELSVQGAAVTVREAFVAAHAATTVQGDFRRLPRPSARMPGALVKFWGKETGRDLPRTLVQDPRVG